MDVVTRKSEVKVYLKACIDAYNNEGVSACVSQLNRNILNRKVKFPLLEFCAHELTREIQDDQHIPFCDEVEALKTEGGNVILGIMLQNRLDKHFLEAIEKTTEYTSKAEIWYVCDIIGERTYGYALLHYPSKTIPMIKALSRDSNNWVLRTLGAGVHYAVKKGLDKKDVAIILPILMAMASATDKEIRQGIGWAAKTIARFHPDVIESHHTEIYNNNKVAHWFRRKVSIGLERHYYYAKRSSS